MKNKSMIGLQSRNDMLLIFGTTAVVLLVSISSQMETVSASPQGGASCNPSPYTPCPPASTEQSQPPNNAEQSQGGSQGTAPASSSSDASSNSNQEAINHINQAQSALQNGDTEGTQQHLDLARNSLGCTPKWPDPC